MRKIGCFLLLAILLAGGAWGYISYYYPLAEGVKTGTLNYITKKGYVFKTWEGRLIQEGLKSGNVNGGIQNNEFIFSVEDERVAKMMETISQNNLQLHYTEYNNPLPWRGYSEFVVDSIISVNNIPVNIYMERMKAGNLPASASQGAHSNLPACQDGQQAAITLDEALQQLRVAQEQIKLLQQQIDRLQQNGGNSSNGYNNNGSSQRRYQTPGDNSHRTDDGAVFPQ